MRIERSLFGYEGTIASAIHTHVGDMEDTVWYEETSVSFSPAGLFLRLRLRMCKTYCALSPKKTGAFATSGSATAASRASIPSVQAPMFYSLTFWSLSTALAVVLQSVQLGRGHRATLQNLRVTKTSHQSPYQGTVLRERKGLEILPAGCCSYWSLLPGTMKLPSRTSV